MFRLLKYIINVDKIFIILWLNCNQLTLDIINFANLLSSDMGQQEYVPYGTVDLLTFEGFEDGNDVSSKPTFTFDTEKYTKTEDVYSVSDFGSRWQMLLGLRVNF